MVTINIESAQKDLDGLEGQKKKTSGKKRPRPPTSKAYKKPRMSEGANFLTSEAKQGTCFNKLLLRVKKSNIVY